jgi:hypothetical protein
MPAGPGAERDRLGAVVALDREEPLRDLVERLVPADPLPLPAAARSGPSQGVL